MSGFREMIAAIDDRINPIMVKELRQAVRGKFIWGVLLLFLGFQCIIFTFSLENEGVYSSNSGSQTMSFLLYILSISSLMLIPIYAGFRFAAESREGSDELLFITTITPHSIIRGKFLASMSIVLLLYSAFAPFMAMTFFLSGVDPLLTAVLLVFTFLLSAASTMFQICIGALARGSSATNLLKGFGLMSQMILFFYATPAFSDLIKYGYARVFGTFEEAQIGITIAGIILGIQMFCYYAAAGIISANGTNRTGSLRKFSTFFWFLSLAAALYWAHKLGSFPPVIIWAYLMTNWMCLLCLVSVSERDYLSRRLARQLSPSRWGRRFNLLFSSGAAGGVVWALLLFLATIATTFVAPAFVSSSSGFSALQSREFYAYIVSTPLFIISYSLLAAFFRRNFLNYTISSRNTWVLALLFTAIMAFLPVLLQAFSPLLAEIVKLFSYLSMMDQAHSPGVSGALIPGLLLLIIAIALNYKWLKGQIVEVIYYSDAIENSSAEQKEAIDE